MSSGTRTGRRPRAVAGALVLASGVALVAGCRSGVEVRPAAGDVIAGMASIGAPAPGPSWAPAPRRLAGLDTVATSDPAGFALSTGHGPVRFLPGVNLGSTVPGRLPGELAITAADYRRWFDAMGRFGIRAVRLYTIHPPALYQELARYNQVHRDAPLYLVQGVYLPDESAMTTQDLLAPEPTAAFDRELADAVAAVNGSLRRTPSPGRAHGTWSADVSPWIAAWIVGVEWDPLAVQAVDRRHADAPPHRGRYFRSAADASPMERWLAARMDGLAAALARRGRSTPIAFVNWPTTDPLRHPEEPLRGEDLVGVDANHVRATSAWPGGTFASYHAYPYYPDFLRYEPGLRNESYRGRPDPYAGYLTALRRHHGDLPVMITEFGVPSSIGSAHHGPLDRDQGGHSEREAMAIDADLLRLIRDQGMAGGFLFEWTDEWFKATWNTVEHQLPADRRQLWHDPLTNEQYFGVIATDPAGYARPEPVPLPSASSSPLARGATARIDESFLWLDLPWSGRPAAPVTLGLDVVPDLVGTAPPGSDDTRADVALVLDPGARNGRLWLRRELERTPAGPARVPAPVTDDGWLEPRLLVNRDQVVPASGRRLPAEVFEIGELGFDDWDGDLPRRDSRSLWTVSGTTLRIRIPWAMAGFADPSSRRVLTPFRSEPTAVVPGVDITLTSAGRTVSLGTVSWPDWQRVRYRERLKDGAETLRTAMIETGDG